MVRISILMVLLGLAAVAMLLAGRSGWASAVALGGFVLGGYAVYRMRAAHGTNVEKFFGDAGDDTRHTGLGSAAPSEMPPEHDRRH